MYDTFMLITGIIFVVMTILTVFMCAVAMLVIKQAFNERMFYKSELGKIIFSNRNYMQTIERSNELEVEKFRHELDCHTNTI